VYAKIGQTTKIAGLTKAKKKKKNWGKSSREKRVTVRGKKVYPGEGTTLKTTYPGCWGEPLRYSEKGEEKK